MDLEGEPSNVDTQSLPESMGSVSDTSDAPNTDLNTGNAPGTDNSETVLPLVMPSSPPSPLASATPTLYASGHPMCLAPKQDIAIHMCCTTKVTLHEIQDCSTVVRCTRAGCETVWVCNPL